MSTNGYDLAAHTQKRSARSNEIQLPRRNILGQRRRRKSSRGPKQSIPAAFNDCWSHMSLNSLISWMSTISKGCVIISSSEALGQLKWVWVSQTARLIRELRTFDSASRGLYGAAEPIWTLRARHFAVLGGLAVILAMAIDPFAQNLVHYYPGLVDDPSHRGLIGKASTNCTWAPAVSLEARALCANITGHLSYSCSVMGEDYNLEGQTNSAWYVPLGDILPWMKGFVGRGVVRRDEAYVYSNLTTMHDRPIVRSFQASVKNNTYSDETLAIWTNYTNITDPIGWGYNPSFGGYFWRYGNLKQAFQPDNKDLYAASDVLQVLGYGEIVGCSDDLATSDNDTGVAFGRVRSNVTNVSVQWPWLTLPIIVWLVAVAALAGTMWKIRQERVPRWKNDPLPLTLMFLYRDSEEDGRGCAVGIPVHGDHDVDD
ncbi:hypothetical protein BDW62DRAFT_216045 [Aspergillus aurantiobrunneus]